MRLIGLKIERMDSSIQKVLKPGWYPFGDYPEPQADGYLHVEPLSHIERNLYRVRRNQPDVSVSCIVGMNGSGKSTVLEIIFRILNNLAVRQCERIRVLIGTDMEYACGVYADLYCECDSYINLIRCRDDVVSCYRYKSNSRTFPLIEELGSPEEILGQLFYTVGVNYSLYAYSKESYRSEVNDQINGNWLAGVFHKNDGYRAPLTLVPFRDNGEISMEKENDLAMRRITTLSVLSKAKGKQFPEGYYPYKLHYKLNIGYRDKKMARFRNNYQPRCQWMDILELVETFEKAWEWLFNKVGLNIVRPSDSDEYRISLFYLAYKAAKISFTYDDYYQILDVAGMQQLHESGDQEALREFIDQELEHKCKAVTMGLYQHENDHITLKIHQTLGYLQEQFWEREDEYNVERLLEQKHPDSYDDVVKILPPPIYDLDVTFEKARRRAGRWHNDDVWDDNSSWMDDKGKFFRLSSMSSGERQVLVAISYVLYHIKNLQSVDQSHYRIPYHHVCVVFDEVELYFHPDYQRRFLSMLIESLSWTKIDKRKIRSIHILIATHSPFILTDVLTERTLYLREGIREHVTEQTFGGNYYDLLDNSFFFRSTAIGEISARATRRWVRQHDHQQRQLTDELNYVGDPFVKRYLQTDHQEHDVADVQTEETL